MVIYGRNPVEEALRGMRRVHRIWATHPEDWEQASAATAEEIEERCGSDAHQGVCALVDPYPYADADELLARPDRCSWRSTRSPTRRTSAPSAARPRRSARPA